MLTEVSVDKSVGLTVGSSVGKSVGCSVGSSSDEGVGNGDSMKLGKMSGISVVGSCVIA